MKNVFMLAALFSFLNLFFGAVSFALSEPQLTNGQVKLGSDVMQAISHENKNFKILSSKNFSRTVLDMKSHPMVAFGDYNNDGLQDVALYGLDLQRNKEVIYMVISQKARSRYKAYLVREDNLSKESQSNNPFFLSQNQAVEYKRDILLVEFFRLPAAAGHTIYFFSNKQDKVISR